MNQTKENRGGARAGAGVKPQNPKGPKKRRLFTLDPDVVDFISRQPNQSQFLENLVRAEMTRQGV